MVREQTEYTSHTIPHAHARMFTHTRTVAGFLVRWVVGVAPLPLLRYHTPSLNCCNGRLSHVGETEVDTVSNQESRKKKGPEQTARSAQKHAISGETGHTTLHQQSLKDMQ